MLPSLTPSTEPGIGPAWTRLAEHVAAQLPVAELDGIWAFLPIRREGKEYGAAILSRIDGDRRRIYTARYEHRIKGKERGEFEVHLEEVGSGPIDALAELLDAVPRRADEESPVAVPAAAWFPAPLPSAEAIDGG